METDPESGRHGKLRGFLFSATAGLAWLALLHWFFSSSAAVVYLFDAFGNGSVKVQGVSGSVGTGISFTHLEDRGENRALVVDGFAIRYVNLLGRALRGEPAIDTVTIHGIEYEEIRLEKPTVEKIRADLAKIAGALEGIALGPGRVHAVTIGHLGVERLSYRPALGAPAVVIGPIEIENFRLTPGGWTADKFQIAGEALQLRTQAVRPRVILSARLTPSFFADATAPFVYRSGEP